MVMLLSDSGLLDSPSSSPFRRLQCRDSGCEQIRSRVLIVIPQTQPLCSTASRRRRSAGPSATLAQSSPIPRT